MHTNIRRLSERGTLQQKTATTNSHGSTAVTWAPLETVAAQEVPISVDERLTATKIGAQATTRFRIRHRTDVTALMRWLWRGRVFEIHGVTNDEGQREYLLLDCGELR